MWYNVDTVREIPTYEPPSCGSHPVTANFILQCAYTSIGGNVKFRDILYYRIPRGSKIAYQYNTTDRRNDFRRIYEIRTERFN